MKGSMYQRGAANGRARLTDEQAAEIRAIFANRVTYKEVARRYGVSAALVGRITRGENWTHTTEEQK